MPERFCSGCRRVYPEEQMRRKKLKAGGIRIICVGCLQRAKTRNDNPPAQSLKGENNE